MPSTAAGTPYTVFTATLPTHGDCHWAIADAHASNSDIPIVLYAHGSGGAANQFATLSAWTGLRNWLIDNGWAWIEGDGGPEAGSNWGNQGARDAYLAYLDHVSQQLNIGSKVLLGRSMGGLVTSWLASTKCAVDFDGWINNSGVSTMLAEAADPGLPSTDPLYKNWQSTARYFGTPIRDAYGQTSYTTLAAYLNGPGADYVPEYWPATVWEGTKILCCYGDADNTVPWATRGAAPVRTIWAGQPAIDLASLRSGGDHTGANGSYLDFTAMTDFLITVTGGLVEPPPPRTHLRIVGAHLYSDGGLLRYAPKSKPTPPV